jgi:hypothetical protein
MAATAADDAVSKPEPAPAPVEPEARPTELVIQRPRRSRVLLVGGVVVVAAGGALALWLGSRGEPPTQPVAVAPAIDAAAHVDPPPPPPHPVAVDAALADTPIDAPPHHPRQTTQQQVKIEPKPQPAVPVATYKVIINTLPRWSNFTIDSDPKMYQTPITIALAPGPHTFHFTGNEYFAADLTKTITVPEKDGSTHVVSLPQPP